MINDEQIARSLGISVEQYHKQQEEARQCMANIVQQVENEKIRMIKQAYQAEIEQDPQILAALYHLYTLHTDISVTLSTRVDEQGNERVVYNWTFTP
jgi:hypothetical protein